MSALLGGRRHHTLPAYVSGLPKATLKERCDLAVEWAGRGYKAIKFAAAMSDDGIVQEMAALREAVGPGVALCVDLHWKFTAGDAIRLIRRLEQHNLWFAEAPCAPEDLEGQAQVARSIGGPLALGEEWRTVFEYRPRFEARAMSIIQPEMGHTGITEFHRIGVMAHAFHVDTIPHASIGCGIFMAASLQATAAQQKVPYHEYQHSIFDKNLQYAEGDMACEAGFYTIPTGPGLGVTPKDAVFQYVIAEGRSDGERKRYQGVYPVLYAFFDADGRLDRDAMRVQVEHCIAAGAHGIMVLGLVTEVHKMDVVERLALVHMVGELIARRVPYAVTVGEPTIAGQVAFAREAQAAGADWVILQPPTAGGGGEAEVVRFFGAVADRLDLPVAVQNNPVNLAVSLSPANLIALHRNHANVTLLKGEGFSVDIARVIEGTDGAMDVFGGHGGLEYMALLRSGGRGHDFPRRIALRFRCEFSSCSWRARRSRWSAPSVCTARCCR